MTDMGHCVTLIHARRLNHITKLFYLVVLYQINLFIFVFVWLILQGNCVAVFFFWQFLAFGFTLWSSCCASVFCFVFFFPFLFTTEFLIQSVTWWVGWHSLG